MSQSEEVACFKNEHRRKVGNFTTAKKFIILYGIMGIVNGANFSYLSGTMTTIEKRFKLSARNVGIISMGTDVAQVLTATALTYIAGRSHRPRWIALGGISQILQMFITGSLHFIYGPGEDAQKLTLEYGGANITNQIEERNHLCNSKPECILEQNNIVQPLILFCANFIGGIGDGLYYTIGIVYIDDIMPKSKSPFALSISQFMRLLGPIVGYVLAASCLRFYVDPFLTPMISIEDPRWIGAWWAGWFIIGLCQCFIIIPMGFFPDIKVEIEQHEVSTSIRDFFQSLWRLTKNKIYTLNNLAGIFYIYSEFPWHNYLSKYIENQYRQNPSYANLLTGSLSLVCTAIGLLSSGIIITRLKPTARTLAAANVVIGILSALGNLSYMFLNCKEATSLYDRFLKKDNGDCNWDCDCSHTAFSPVCSENSETFISPCYAGCRDIQFQNNIKDFINCSCTNSGTASLGACPIDCTPQLYTFLAINCFLKLLGAAGFASNFLVGIRCIKKRDKTLAMGVSMTLLAFFSFCIAPILYGTLIDKSCVFWGKTCSNEDGNCWLYDGEKLAAALSLTSAGALLIGSFFDASVWYYSKNLQIFDDF